MARINNIAPLITKDNWAYDAFGKLRISQPETIFDSKLTNDNAPLFWDDQEVSGGSTSSTYNTDQASVTLAVANTTAGVRTRQTFMRFNYQPGKSQLIMMTGIIGVAATGIDVEVGLVDDDNGLFFYTDGTNVGVCVRTNTSGSPVDAKVAQSAWSLDPMDGSGPSGVTLDFTKTQIMFFDFEWLGVGSVRFGFVVDGIPIYVHEVLNANSLALVYMSTPNLPLRWSIENSGAGAVASITQICSTVISEGGTQATGSIRYKSTNGTHTTATTENVVYAVLGISLQTTKIDGIIELLGTSLYIQSATDVVEWTLRLNPTVASVFTYNNETNSSAATAVGVTANTVTGGTIIAGGYLQSGNNNSGLGAGGVTSLKNAIRLGANIAGTTDTMVLCVMPIGGTAGVEVEGLINWREQ